MANRLFPVCDGFGHERPGEGAHQRMADPASFHHVGGAIVKELDPELMKAFGEPISVYSDAQAVEDGFLIPLTPRDRVSTRPT